MTTYIGIDPGLAGGIAWTGPDGAAAERIPETDREIIDLLSPIARDAVAVLEQVHAMPKNGSVASFKLGGSYRALRMALTALAIPFIEAPPQQWQRVLGLTAKRPAGVEAQRHYHEKKLKQKARAQRLFPHLKVTLATADALLIAQYCARLDWRGVERFRRERAD